MANETNVAAKEVLAGLRATLDSDKERSNRKFTLLRRKLVSFFDWNGAESPEISADDALITAAWKLTDGKPVQNVVASCVAIARDLLKKEQQAREAQPGAANAAPPPASDPLSDPDRIRNMFETNLDALGEENRDLVVTYYSGRQAQLVAARQELSQRLQMPLNQLRVRAHRTRTQLEQTVLERLAPPAAVKR